MFDMKQNSHRLLQDAASHYCSESSFRLSGPLIAASVSKLLTPPPRTKDIPPASLVVGDLLQMLPALACIRAHQRRIQGKADAIMNRISVIVGIQVHPWHCVSALALFLIPPFYNVCLVFTSAAFHYFFDEPLITEEAVQSVVLDGAQAGKGISIYLPKLWKGFSRLFSRQRMSLLLKGGEHVKKARRRTPNIFNCWTHWLYSNFVFEATNKHDKQWLCALNMTPKQLYVWDKAMIWDKNILFISYTEGYLTGDVVAGSLASLLATLLLASCVLKQRSHHILGTKFPLVLADNWRQNCNSSPSV